MPDHFSRKPVAEPCRISKGMPRQPCREKPGIEGIAGPRSIERLNGPFRTDMIQLVIGQDDAAVPACLHHDFRSA